MIIIDDQKIYIKNYQDILMMDQEIFKVKMDDYDLYLYGNDLEMYYFDKNEMRLSGQVREIGFYASRV